MSKQQAHEYRVVEIDSQDRIVKPSELENVILSLNTPLHIEHLISLSVTGQERDYTVGRAQADEIAQGLGEKVFGPQSNPPARLYRVDAIVHVAAALPHIDKELGFVQPQDRDGRIVHNIMTIAYVQKINPDKPFLL